MTEADRSKTMQDRLSGYTREMILPIRNDLDLKHARALLEIFDSAPAWSRRKAVARGEIVDAFSVFSKGMKLTEAKELFVNRYNTNNNHLGISDKTYKIYEKISRPSLDLWRSRKKEMGLAGLLESTTRGKPHGRITPEMHHYIIGIISRRPQTRPARVYDYLVNKFSSSQTTLPSETTIRRHINKWIKENGSAFAFMKNPDQWRSARQAAFGDAGEKALHFLHIIEFDNTPADILCADKKRYTITAGIDMFSRKAKCLVVPVSRSVAVAGLMRWMILNWGLFDVMIADNGKDYASKHIEAVCGALGIELPPVPAFSPEKKPFVERFFRTLSTMLFEELDGYIGHNVAERKAIESRKSFAQRMFDRDETIECRMMPDELQEVVDTWVEKVYHQRKHGELGKSPNERAGESAGAVRKILDERVLDILLAPIGKPTVGKKGIRYRNGYYAAIELAGHIGERVQIRQDLADAGRLYVFNEASKFICIARDAALEGISVEDANRARRRQKKQIKQQVQAFKTLAEGVGDPMAELLEARRTSSGQVINFNREEIFENETVRQAKKAGMPHKPIETFVPDPPIAAEKADKVVPIREEEPFFESRLARYKHISQQEKIRELTDIEKAFKEGYEGSEEYYKIFVMPFK